MQTIFSLKAGMYVVLGQHIPNRNWRTFRASLSLFPLGRFHLDFLKPLLLLTGKDLAVSHPFSLH